MKKRGRPLGAKDKRKRKRRLYTALGVTGLAAGAAGVGVVILSKGKAKSKVNSIPIPEPSNLKKRKYKVDFTPKLKPSQPSKSLNTKSSGNAPVKVLSKKEKQAQQLAIIQNRGNNKYRVESERKAFYAKILSANDRKSIYGSYNRRKQLGKKGLGQKQQKLVRRRKNRKR